MSRLLKLAASASPDPAVDRGIQEQPGELGAIAKRWFDAIRGCRSDVRELLHDGHPTACVT